jgi:hypothetical protein
VIFSQSSTEPRKELAMGFSIGDLNPLSLVSNAAESICDTILPKNLEFVGDLVGIATAFETGDWLGCLDGAVDLFKDLPQQLSALGQHGSPNRPGNDTNASPSLEPTPPTPYGAGSSTRRASDTTPRRSAVDAASAPESPAVPPANGASVRAVAVDGPKGSSADAFFALTDKDLMDAVRNGTIPDSVAKDPKQMQRLQARMNDITQMNQLVTMMLNALHEMNKQVIQNIRA